MWRVIKQFPKFLLVFVVLVGSTFWFWWWWNHRVTATPQVQQVPTPVEEKAPDLASRVGRLFVANGDLYDVDTGEVVIKRWLKGDAPLRLWFEPVSGKIIGNQGGSFARYNLNGSREGVINAKSGLVVNEEAKIALFAKERDIWRSEIDWQEFKLVNERRVTSVGQIMESFFIQNILMGSDKTLVLRNMNTNLRVNLDTGEVAPVKPKYGKAVTSRSPDGAMMAGEDWSNRGTNLIVYELDADKMSSLPLKENQRINSFLWLNKERCAFIIGMEKVFVFDHKTASVRQAVKLPTKCTAMIAPSPKAQYLLCAGGNAVVLADLESGKTEVIQNPGQDYRWIADDTLLFAREIPDSNLRGTWVKRIGEAEIRVENDPFVFERGGIAGVSRNEDEGLIVFATKTSLFKMKNDELIAVHLAETARPVTRLQWIERWKD